MRLATKWTLLLVLGLTGTAAALGQQDVPGSADHPMISRFKGSAIVGQERKDFDAYTLPLGPPEGDHFRKQQNLEGKITRTIYLAPAGSSALLVYRNYENALKQAGFQTLFSCAAEQCRGDVGLYNYYQRPWMITPMGGHSFGDDYHVLVAKLSRPAGDVYVSLCSGPQYGDASKVYTAIDVVEVKPMAGGLVTVNAAELANDISQTGHASVYGIYFDTGKADLKPESDATLAEIAKLLASNSALKLHVVGHTDNVGGFAANMTLSKQRADAVVAALVSKYHVSAARLQAAGVGPLAPVASNKSEEGRAKNRRVELVEQ
jgi:OmpA-OmpF porin, OOP family